jgi:hypothetical protein
MRRLVILAVVCAAAVSAYGADALRVGWAQADITPERAVALVGQMHKRISTSVMDPLTATALAIEMGGEQAIMVSCDVIFTQRAIQERVREAVRFKIAEFDTDKLILNATHTHTAPGFIDSTFKGLYDVSGDEGVMKASEYAAFFVERVADAAVRAWRGRKEAGASWALGHAVVGMNRRVHYFDGHTDMYGGTAVEGFSNIEGGEDHGVEMLFFWDGEGKLTGVAVNVACTSQETENLNEVSADFWHDVRVELRRRFSKDLFVLPQCAAAGDQSPHYVWRSRAEAIMAERRGLSNRQEIARRIADAVEDAAAIAAKHVETRPVFRHTVARVDLPAHSDATMPFYETDPLQGVEIHAVRLGDVVIATNPFELFLDYGVRMKARSPAVLTFVVQLACQNLGYLPTARAVAGGGYSADKFVVGPEGGQRLVDETVRLINAMWN